MRTLFVSIAAIVVLAAGCRQPAVPDADPVTRDGEGRGRTADACTAEPLVAFDASLDVPMSETTLEFEGVLESSDPADEFGRVSYRFTSSGGPRRLVVRGATLPLRDGASYAVRVERVGGSPPASGLLVRDANGLVFAAASDQTIGGLVLAGGVPGFALRLENSTCASRGAGECFRAAVNRPLRVQHGDASATLHHGDVARLGAFDVRCLIAQQVEYGGCPDFALHAVSFTIARAGS